MPSKTETARTVVRKTNKSQKQSQVNVHSRKQRTKYNVRGASAKHSGIALFYIWLFGADFVKDGILH